MILLTTRSGQWTHQFPFLLFRPNGAKLNDKSCKLFVRHIWSKWYSIKLKYYFQAQLKESRWRQITNSTHNTSRMKWTRLIAHVLLWAAVVYLKYDIFHTVWMMENTAWLYFVFIVRVEYWISGLIWINFQIFQNKTDQFNYGYLYNCVCVLRTHRILCPLYMAMTSFSNGVQQWTRCLSQSIFSQA